MFHQLLDHGYLKFVEAYGTGEAGVAYDPAPDAQRGTLEHALSCGVARHADYEVGIIEAARQSTAKGFNGWDADQKLLRYLYENKHGTPFEFAGLIIEVQAPIMVFREWHRHRTQSYNEMSGRYTQLPDLYYHANPENVWERAQKAMSPTTRQMAALNGVGPLTEEAMIEWLAEDEDLSVRLEQHYQKGLQIGLPKEIARKKTPIDHYSRMRAAGNLRNWLAFMTLRCDPHAQWEIRQYAWAVANIIGATFPQTYKLWSESL